MGLSGGLRLDRRVDILRAFLSVQYSLSTTDKAKKLQAQSISLSFGIPIISGIITEVVLPARGIRIPE